MNSIIRLCWKLQLVIEFLRLVEYVIIKIHRIKKIIYIDSFMDMKNVSRLVRGAEVICFRQQMRVFYE